MPKIAARGSKEKENIKNNNNRINNIFTTFISQSMLSKKYHIVKYNNVNFKKEIDHTKTKYSDNGLSVYWSF